MQNSDTGNTSKGSSFEKLLNEVSKRRMKPEDKYEVAAIIESMGWNDARAKQEFGVGDIFDLASDLWNSMQVNFIFSPSKTVKKESILQIIVSSMRSFLRGLIFALPMAISVVAMLTLRISLWSYQYLSLELATSISIGTILSFLTVGGFTQAIARRGFFYTTQNYYNMARRITNFFVKFGYVLAFILSLVFSVFNAFFQMFPIRMTMVIVLYYFFLTAIWLSVTVMYILQKELAFTGLLIIGIILVAVLFYVFKFDIILSQMIALILATAAAIILVRYFFAAAEARMETRIEPLLPRLSITLYSVLPYFIYGFLYFAFLFSDRIMAWSTNNKYYMPYIIWFRGPYEMGLDLALVMLILPLGFIEVIVSRFMKELAGSQQVFSPENAKKMSGIFVRAYFWRAGAIVLLSLISAAIIYFTVYMLSKYSSVLALSGILDNKVTNMVFVVALISYAGLSFALMNAVVLFSLSQPEMVNKSVLPALLVNLITGFVLSRWIEYHFAVYGLLAGTIVFMALSALKVVKVMGSIDYYLYAAS
jgi:hypothetical protein